MNWPGILTLVLLFIVGPFAAAFHADRVEDRSLRIDNKVTKE